MQTLRGQGVLAKIEYESLDYDARRIDLSTNTTHNQYFVDFEDIHPDVLRKLAEEHRRNRRILERLLSGPPMGSPALRLFDSARTGDGQSAATRRSVCCVCTRYDEAGDASSLNRTISPWQLVGALQLRSADTGFDAPSVRCVVVARPNGQPDPVRTNGGRGMRGPSSGELRSDW